MTAQAIWATDPADVRVSHDTAPGLIEGLRRLGDDYGPLGVALAAADLTDTRLLIERLTAERGDDDPVSPD